MYTFHIAHPFSIQDLCLLTMTYLFSKEFSVAHWSSIDPVTPKITSAILPTVCHTILKMPIWRI